MKYTWIDDGFGNGPVTAVNRSAVEGETEGHESPQRFIWGYSPKYYKVVNKIFKPFTAMEKHNLDWYSSKDEALATMLAKIDQQNSEENLKNFLYRIPGTIQIPNSDYDPNEMIANPNYDPNEMIEDPENPGEMIENPNYDPVENIENPDYDPVEFFEVPAHEEHSYYSDADSIQAVAIETYSCPVDDPIPVPNGVWKSADHEEDGITPIYVPFTCSEFQGFKSAYYDRGSANFGVKEFHKNQIKAMYKHNETSAEDMLNYDYTVGWY